MIVEFVSEWLTVIYNDPTVVQLFTHEAVSDQI